VAPEPDRRLAVATGVRLGVDVGTVRVGVAVSDPSGILASPVGTLARDTAQGTDLARLAALVVERAAVEVVVGLPRSLSGAEGKAAVAARAYGARLASQIAPVPVVYQDERLTSAGANRMLAERGINSKKSRRVVDQVAAVSILQDYLDRTRSRDGSR
jgi:putative Holliday junction resolvase